MRTMTGVSPTALRWARVVDLACLSGLLIVVGVLGRLRGASFLTNPALVWTAVVVAFCVILVWLLLSRRRRDDERESERPLSLDAVWLPIAALSLVAIVAFFLPMTFGFWHGYDDPLMLSFGNLNWFDYDQSINRPFVPLGPTIALH